MRYALILMLAACGGATAGHEPDEYVGCATDELWPVFDAQDKSATVADATAPLITMPSAGAMLTDPVVFKWNLDSTNAGMAGGNVPSSCEGYNTGALGTLHQAPISGDAYDLQFAVGADVVWRVLTTLQEWKAPAEMWSRVKGKTVTLKIFHMAVINNDTRQGPYVPATPFSFSVAN